MLISFSIGKLKKAYLIKKIHTKDKRYPHLLISFIFYQHEPKIIFMIKKGIEKIKENYYNIADTIEKM